MIFKGYTKRDTSILKGFAILCIVFHNFFHWIPPIPGENEFMFHPQKVMNLFRFLGEQPGEFVNTLFSYFGHYGVQLFVFLSGFGLAVSMLRHEKDWGLFVMERWKKIYPLLLTGFVVCFLGTIVMRQRMFTAEEWREIGYKALFIHTLIPDEGVSINGPWWFFSLIIQLYFLFPLLFKWFRKWGWKAFWVVCAVCYGMIFLFRYVWNLHHGNLLMMNAPGHLPEFCLGILLAFSKDKKISVAWLLLAVAVFCLGNFFGAFNPFTFLALTVMAVFAYQGLKSLPFRKTWLSRPLAYVGGLSMMLFVVHGFFRAPFVMLAGNMATPWGNLMVALLFFLTSWLIALGAERFYGWLSKWFEKIRPIGGRAGKVTQRVVQVLLLLFFTWVLGYYVWQNLAYKSLQPLEAKIQVETGSVERTDDFVGLGICHLEKNYPVLRMKGHLELKSADDQSVLPFLVISIPNACWKCYELKASTDGWLRYDFDDVFSRPFVVGVKDKDMKVYFWNRQGSELQFRDARLEVNY